ncbi:acyl-CoA-binding domain-containing protein 5A [Syngnathoides biaculeatus]|uniref:acyl-CoA-binding domain-containing protein 5A n=1 Tax=Syngnathoides biaculeatus TaxID=300417 RepID=UPI002ADDE08D|nr:acyl-CoA-binding domain-containing protein 5A [Syngnathoides biaculeatus]XP_061661229.1 acyl-CoA-binding domain-containing protein 5A [Syngnathoides biaculeatus]XP_061661230.1 acyl-CoA-binding domain-containing protein 5A [Syngnathoides biaculeatus]XP_061661231.1 acyl-CoA-binding domain-containing protein 5A [Syngnathoides biaculeatus]XP_061661232.1 acyl-CoA-binding domain-containing protein 5A [Syngnathoides biaculeatus]
MEVAQSLGADEQTRLTQLRFDAAVKVIKSLPPNGSFQPSNDMMLKFYSYYKQATVGKCNIARPGFWDAVGKAKWNAWNSLGEMTKEDAMAAYVDEMKLILEGMPVTGEVEELLRIIGPFYELVDDKKKITQISDLSAGFGSRLSAASSRSVAKSVIRTMELNGTLETRPAKPAPDDRKETSGKVAREEAEDEFREASQPKKNAAPRRRTADDDAARLPDARAPDALPLLNGHRADAGEDVTGRAHLASDSDSEVYCDSVDQFGQNESPEQNCSTEDLDEEEQEEEKGEEPVGREDVQRAPRGIRCGGEDGDAGGSTTQRSRLDVDTPNSSVGGGRGSMSYGRAPGALKPARGAGEGDDDDDGGGGGERRGGPTTPAGSLNEQIVAALAQLQDDMRSVLDRLHALEALAATQARSAAVSPVHPSAPPNKKTQNPSWWPLDISPRSLAFAVVWPFVVHWLIGLYAQRRRRRLN